tara:strand:+ start:1915 stop:2478 length:564 start_codon:yes stop_codon:yes gene_type:complete
VEIEGLKFRNGFQTIKAPNYFMATITLEGVTAHTCGQLPKLGSKAPNFSLVDQGLNNHSLNSYLGKKVVLNIFPSVDTGICANSVRTFNREAAELDNVVVLNISRDLPFSFKRFCIAEEIKNVITLSEFRDSSFSDRYNVLIMDGDFEGLMSRAVIIIDEQGIVIYSEQVPEIAQDPNFEAALAMLK